ncbi:MAG: cytochrome c peroxidase [Saprospiraceae bacterium]
MKPKDYFIANCLFFSLLSTSCTDLSQETSQYTTLDFELMALIRSQSLNGTINYYELPASNDYNKIPQDPKNPLSKDKVALGAFLFHETGLSVDAKDANNKNTYSCASCHHAGAGFQSGLRQAIGEGGQGFGSKGEARIPNLKSAYWDVQSIRTPTVLNVAYQTNLFWNGQFGATHQNTGTEHLWTEDSPSKINKLGYLGVESSTMGSLEIHGMTLNEKIIQLPAYRKLFDSAFSDEHSDQRYSQKNASLAIAAYLRTMLPNEAPFQKYLKGNVDAMSMPEKEGALLFFGKANCAKCHNGPALNSNKFSALGFSDLVDHKDPTIHTQENEPINLGRASFTRLNEDKFKFKIPQLYNMTDSPHYGHGSSFDRIIDVLNYKNQAIAQNKRVTATPLDPLFVPLKLSQEEVTLLESFLKYSLYDKNLQRYVPQVLPSGLCFPNADLNSKYDMNCF